MARIVYLALIIAALLISGCPFGGGVVRDDLDLPASTPSGLAEGEQLYNSYCAECHGVQGIGTKDKGPPLLHELYTPENCPDEDFYQASFSGARMEHWAFGMMIPVPDEVDQSDVGYIIQYIRWLQEEVGLI